MNAYSWETATGTSNAPSVPERGAERRLWASVEPDLVLALEPEFRWERVNDVAVTLDLRPA